MFVIKLVSRFRPETGFEMKEKYISLPINMGEKNEKNIRCRLFLSVEQFEKPLLSTQVSTFCIIFVKVYCRELTDTLAGGVSSWCNG